MFCLNYARREVDRLSPDHPPLRAAPGLCRRQEPLAPALATSGVNGASVDRERPRQAQFVERTRWSSPRRPRTGSAHQLSPGAPCPTIVCPAWFSPTAPSARRSPPARSRSTRSTSRCIQPSSVDLHVDRYFRLFRNHTSRVIDVREDQEDLTELVDVGEDDPSSSTRASSCSAPPSSGSTLPDDLVARLEGKSSLGRLGLLIHSTAGFVDAGWDGHLTLELSNVANLPITVYPGMKIGQISFLQMTTPADHPYGSDGPRARSTRASGARPPAGTPTTSAVTRDPATPLGSFVTRSNP